MTAPVFRQSTPRVINNALSTSKVAAFLRHCAYAECRLMEAQASWMPFIPYPELKIELAYQLYDDACHVDAMIRRMPEVGAFDKRMRPANDAIVTLMNEFTNTRDLIEQLVGVFWVIRPRLVHVYEEFLAIADSVADNPTVRILENAIADHQKYIAWGEDTLNMLIATDADRERAEAWRTHLLGLLTASGCLNGDQPIPSNFAAPTPRDASAGYRFRPENPVRDDRFRVMPYVRHEGRAATDVWDHESLLKYMFNNVEGEIEATEACARTLYDFPNAPWDLRFLIARQMWDEARHAEQSMHRFEEMGGTYDMLPVRDAFPLYWGPVHNTELPKRLAHLNQVIEGWVTDDFAMMVDICRGLGDERSAHLFEFLIADEWLHIKIGSEWIPRLTAHDPAYRDEVVAYRTKVEQEHFKSLDLAAWEVRQKRATGEISRVPEASE